MSKKRRRNAGKAFSVGKGSRKGRGTRRLQKQPFPTAKSYGTLRGFPFYCTLFRYLQRSASGRKVEKDAGGLRDPNRARAVRRERVTCTPLTDRQKALRFILKVFIVWFVLLGPLKVINPSQ